MCDAAVGGEARGAKRRAGAGDAKIAGPPAAAVVVAAAAEEKEEGSVIIMEGEANASER
jgi:hypothetical protein